MQYLIMQQERKDSHMTENNPSSDPESWHPLEAGEQQHVLKEISLDAQRIKRWKETIERILQASQTPEQSDSACYLVLGPTGIGKTTVIRTYQKEANHDRR